MEFTGAHILLKCLKEEGVDLMFGYPGGVTLDIYDAMAEYDIRHILVRHEQAAVHAADGFARASGKVGVCLVTSGPGATNTVTGIANAYADSIPMVIFTGQVPASMIGNDAFQEVDILGITRPCTKHNYMVTRVEDLLDVVRKAFYLARNGRPGPVLVDLPRNVLMEKTEFNYPAQPVHMRTYQPNLRPNINQLRKAVKAIKESARPLILAGGGAIMAGATACLSELANKYQIPVTSTLMGLGSFDAASPLNLGMLGMHGLYAANKAVSACDVMIAVGVRFDDRVTGRVSAFAPNAQIIHIDIDPTSIRKNVQVSIPIVADCKIALSELSAMLEADVSHGTPNQAQSNQSGAQIGSAQWLDQLAQWQARCPASNKDCPVAWPAGQVSADECMPSAANLDEGNAIPSGTKEVPERVPEQALQIKPQEAIQAIHKIATKVAAEQGRGEPVIATEVGQHQMWVAQVYPFSSPRTLITSGGLGTMGFGFPAAIGAQFALPNSLVLDIAGDGSIQMNIQELATVAANNLPVKIIILNNGCLGMVRQLQEIFYFARYNAVSLDVQPDFVKLAEAYGLEGYQINKASQLELVLQKALASPKAAIVNIQVAQAENVYPMVPAGAGLEEMLLA